MTTLVTQEGGWPWRPDKCPADEDFLDWFGSQQATGPKRIFQMGPGEHHAVGRHLTEWGHSCLSVTVSTEEVDAYMKWAIENPTDARRYHCLFADVQNIGYGMLPTFDILYLPHLGEMPDPRRDAYGMSVQDTLAQMLDEFHGYLVLYGRSAAHGDMTPVREWLADNSKLTRLDDYKSLEIWRKL